MSGAPRARRTRLPFADGCGASFNYLHAGEDHLDTTRWKVHPYPMCTLRRPAVALSRHRADRLPWFVPVFGGELSDLHVSREKAVPRGGGIYHRILCRDGVALGAVD